jgi:O-antigen ligase
VRRALYSVLAGAVLVALAGIAVYLVRHASAIQQPTVQNGVRYRGVGQNPNTVSMLLAVATPIAALFTVEARTWALRAAGAAAFLLLEGSIVASGSRGALVASFGALLVLGLAWPHTWRTRAAAAVGAALCLAIGAGITKLPKPLSPTDPRAQTSASANPHAFSPHDADFFLRLEDEIGRPAGGGYRPPEHRGLLGGSGRGQSWQGAIDQGKKRPIAGYGFGTEPKVFVDRYYAFEGGVAENSFVGLFLQLGLAGPLLFLVLVGTLVAAGVRALRTLADRGAVAVCASVLLVGLALAVVQSYVYAAGNTATLGVWICAFLPAAAAAR